ncbi:GNAT family N-acetyltransferase [Candidatus Gracilibacteria bacterium]|nr:GNAT family N-acetyltransferase [Candidatus Gracilibacteria bacterium]
MPRRVRAAAGFAYALRTIALHYTRARLFWAIAPQHQRCGYATEAARAMIDHAFGQLRIKRLIATTEYTNLASQAVMAKVGMRVERNPLSTPPWLEIVGVIEHPSL